MTGIRETLPLSHPFHSPLALQSDPMFRQNIAKTFLSNPQCHLYLCHLSYRQAHKCLLRLEIRGDTMKGIIFSLLLVGALAAQADVKFDRSISESTKTQITEDLGFVKTMEGKGGSALYQQIFAKAALNGTDLMDFFGQRISTFSMNSCGGGNAVAACVIPWMDSHTMWITPNYVKNNIPQIFRISIIFHESRHTEDEHGNWGHATCPTPYLDDNGKDIVGIISGTKMAGMPACDNQAIGAYGLQAVLLKNIEKNCSNCNQKVQMDAKLFGDDSIYRISNLAARKQLKNDL